MINKRDPAEWQAQVEQSPESAPYVVRILLARLQTLDEENERQRNTNLDLCQKIDTKAHQTEVTELKRQLKAMARLVQGDYAVSWAQPILLVWSKQGDILAVDLRAARPDAPIDLPATWQDESQWRLIACSAHDEMLVVTKTGNSTIFTIEDLLQVSQKSRDWHHIPGLRLARDEFIAFITPIARVPLSEGLITISVRGVGRKFSRWALDQSLQSGQFGKGIRDERDWQTLGELALHPKSHAMLVTRSGISVRFPVESFNPNAAPAMKNEYDDPVIALLLDDTPRQQVALIDTEGRALRRDLSGIAPASMGTKGKPIITTDALAAAVLIDEADQLAALIGGGTSFRIQRIDASAIPFTDRAKAPNVALFDSPVIAAASVRIGGEQ